jgi:hypothetical protein
MECIMKAAISFGYGWNSLSIVVDAKDIGKTVELINNMQFVGTHYADGKTAHYVVDNKRKIEIELIDTLLPGKPAEE